MTRCQIPLHNHTLPSQLAMMIWFMMSHTVGFEFFFLPCFSAEIGANAEADYYGRRMATVSSDQRLKVFDLSDDGDWVLSESIRAHEASITRVGHLYS